MRVKYLVITIILILMTASLKGQNSHTVYSLGNIADVEDKKLLANHLVHLTKQQSANHTIVLNGDLIDFKINDYNLKDIKDFLTLLDEQLAGPIIIIPGDRDWNKCKEKGWENIKKFEDTVKSWNLKNIHWPLDDGCPGPEDFELSSNLLLIAINTQWWNYPFRKPTPADADCKISTMTAFLEQLEENIDENPTKNVLIAGHYPLRSNGIYGGKIPLRQWLLPVPLVSGMISSFRQNVGRPEDLNNQKFAPFAKTMINVLGNYNSLIYLGAHEKNTQFIRGGSNFIINSGSPNDKSPLSGKAYYQTEKAGLTAIRYEMDGSVSADVYQYNSRIGFGNVASVPLMQSPCDDKKETLDNQRFIPCMSENLVLNEMQLVHPKTAVKTAGEEYSASPSQRFLLGQHYRSSWTTPVEIPYLNLDTTFQGLRPYARGGGRQTQSLKMQGKDGMEYVFRSVNKDPVKALPYALRNTLIADILRDQTTTQQPYGAMAASNLLDNLPILHARPKLYIMPNDPMLGPFQTEYGGMLGMLEEKPKDDLDSIFGNADDVKSTLKLFRELYEDNDNHIDKDEFLIARVFDILVGDWGKHEDNWKWVGYDKKKGRLYKPVPRDRDHVFSRWDGLFPWLADREWAKASGENFDYKIKGLRSLMWQARHLDRALLNEATLLDWQRAAEIVQQNITDEDIEQAVKSMPKEIYGSDGKIIEEKLKARKKDLKVYAEKYYRTLAKQVDLIGSEKDEFFDIRRNEDGTVDAVIHKIKKGEKGAELYSRKFYPQETREIRLFGLDDTDVFSITGSTKKSMLIRVIPGPGKDVITEQSTVNGLKKHTFLYDNEQDSVSQKGELKRAKTKNPDAYIYNRTAFAYNTYLPLPYITYNADNGLGLNLGVSFTRQSYGKPDFSSIHTFSIFATTEENLQFEYKGRWRHVIGNWDGQASLFLANPIDFNFFFGVGNDTEKDDSLFDDDFYEVRYNSYRINAGLNRTFLSNSMLSFDLGYEINSEQLRDNIFDVIETPITGGDEELQIFTSRARLNLDFRDQPNLPKKGMRLHVNYLNGQVFDKNENFGIATGSLEQFISNYWRKPLVLGVKIGGSTSHGSVPYYHLQYLGQNNNLRGFRRHRFTGKSAAFSNAEFRAELFRINTKIVPMKVGIKTFVDAGRIFDDLDVSDDWHIGYGGGFYVVPLREQFSINLSAAFSDEESGLILISIGKSFN